MAYKVHHYIQRHLRWSSLLFTLIDPEKLQGDHAGRVAAAAEAAGSHAMLVGGSTGVNGHNLDATVKAIKAAVQVPVILFPGGADGFSRHADAVLFMQMMNSRSPRYLMEEQVAAVDRIREAGVETIPMGYIVVEPGGRAGEVGEARLVPRDAPHDAVRYALAAQYFGMAYVYLEAGSGADSAVPPDHIRRVKENVTIPVIAGGGIRDAVTARDLVSAGADVIVTGNVLEGPVDVQKTLTEIIRESIDALRRKFREAV